MDVRPDGFVDGGLVSVFVDLILTPVSSRGCIDKILRKKFSPKKKLKYGFYRYEHAEHLSSSKFFKKISVSYSVVSQKIVHGKIVISNLVLFLRLPPSC